MGPKPQKTRSLIEIFNELDNKDRLSFLPHEALMNILSRLPFKDAVSTSILSRQWRYRWTQMTSITIDYNHFHDSRDIYSEVDSFISQLASPIIHEFTLRVENSRKIPCLFADSMLDKICGREVEVINVIIDSTCKRRLFFIPATNVFQSQTLVKLHLINSDYYDYRFADDPVNLPKLESLVLALRPSQCWIVGRLTRASPLLKDIKLIGSRNADDKDRVMIDIFNQKLSSLIISFLDSPESTSYVIKAPNLDALDHFVFRVNGSSCSVVIKPRIVLQEVEIVVRSKAIALSVLKQVSSTKHLKLDAVTVSAIKGVIEADWNGEVMIYDDLTMITLSLRNDKVNLDWNTRDFIPENLLTKVKVLTIDIGLLTNEAHLLNLVKFLLGRAPVLEELALTLSNSKSDEKQGEERIREMMFYMELSRYPRRSSQCTIEFRGNYVKVTAKVVLFRMRNGHYLCRQVLDRLKQRQ